MTRINVEYWAPRWFWLLAIAAYAIVMLGCAHSPTEPAANTPQEEWVLSETTKFAGMIHKDISGVLTN